MINISPTMPVKMRILYTYTAAAGVEWGEVSSIFLEEARKTPLIEHLFRLQIKDVIDLIVTNHKLDGAIVLVDETRRWLDVDDIRRQIPEETLTTNVKHLVLTIMQNCDKRGRMAIFTALSASFIRWTNSPAGRILITTNLNPLDDDSSNGWSGYRS